jgi:hypothetical protein
MPRIHRLTVQLLLAALPVLIACGDSTAPRNDDDPVTDIWELSAKLTTYQHDGGSTPGCWEHCPVTDSVAGPRKTLVGTLMIGSDVVHLEASSTYTQASITFVARTCTAFGADSVCTQFGPEQPASTEMGPLSASAGFPDGGSLDGTLTDGWTILDLRHVALAGDSLSGVIEWRYNDGRAIPDSYSGTFVAHRKR